MVSQLLFPLFSLGLLLSAGAQSTTVQELYVKPTEDTSCPEPCHTLDEYVQNATQYFVSNTVLKFLPGTHNLSQSLRVSGVSNLVMTGVNSSAEIKCTLSYYVSVLSFTQISNLTLEDLTLSSCTVLLTNLLNFNILRVNMEHLPNCSYLYGVPYVNALNILGASSFAGLTVVGPWCSNTVTLRYSNEPSWSPSWSTRLTIKDSTFTALNFHIEFYHTTYNVTLLLHNLTVNVPGWLNSLDIYIASPAPNRLFLSNSHLNATGAISISDFRGTDSSVHIYNCVLKMSLHLLSKSTRITLENSLVHHGMLQAMKPAPFFASGLQNPFVIKNVTFSDFRTPFYVPKLQPVHKLGLFLIEHAMHVSFIECKFLHHNGRGPANSQALPVITLVDSKNISFTDCEFGNNLGTAISAVNSEYTLSGSNTFRNNSAYRGGALVFYGESYVTFTDGSDTLFENNSADTVGGAIYVDYGTNTDCFFHGDSQDFLSNEQFRFEGNTAENGGGRVYGALFDACIVPQYWNTWIFASDWFHFDPRNTSNFSAVTSDPLRACLCVDGRPSCTTVFSNCTQYPGEAFHLPAVVVGDRFGTVDGSVYAQFLLVGDGVAELGGLERSQRVEHLKCTNLTYSILSNSSYVIVTLAASSVPIRHYPSDIDITIIRNAIAIYKNTGSIQPVLGLSPVYINITLLPCPLGFMLSGEPPSCICDTYLQDNHISCNLTTQTVQRSGTEWVNASFHNGNGYNGMIVSNHCPNNYCKPETVDVDLEDPDTQCAFNRSGILCGGCQSGLSLALGSAQCLSCSNAYLALLIPFALAGLVLVFFIKLLKLTVAQGTLNGLIFYANIVRANQVAWMPSPDQNILTVFIAWINLDLGIETCFFDGLDAYWVTWLEFVFPFYIWTIVILIILLSHYFSAVAKLFGSNSVPTLATLFLLSYPKLLRTIISIFQISTVDYPDGASETVWSYDGNIRYLSPKLIPLFFVATVAVVFLWLPYTGTLTFAQCLQKSSIKTIVKFLMRLKPFLDAYFGPLKDKHRYWVGLLLNVRGILFISFAATPTEHSEADLLITLVVVFCVTVYLVHVSVYKRNYLSLLEASFLLNLGVLAGGTLYVQLARKNQSALAYTSVGIAFTQFVVIVFVHGIYCLKEARWVRKLCLQFTTTSKPPAVDRPNQYDRLMNAEPLAEAAQQLVVSFNAYREPMLKYLDNTS